MLCAGLVSADENAVDRNDEISGHWLTEGGLSTVLLEVESGLLTGTVVELAEPLTENGEVKTDRYNPDPALRLNPIIGMRILWGFRRDDSGKWVKGRVYDPEEGRTYHAGITQEGDRLLLRGSLDRWGMLGRTTVWTRQKKEF